MSKKLSFTCVCAEPMDMENSVVSLEGVGWRELVREKKEDSCSTFNNKEEKEKLEFGTIKKKSHLLTQLMLLTFHFLDNFDIRKTNSSFVPSGLQFRGGWT